MGSDRLDCAVGGPDEGLDGTLSSIGEGELDDLDLREGASNAALYCVGGVDRR